MTYPKWVNRGLGDAQVILCLNEEEEAAFVGRPQEQAIDSVEPAEAEAPARKKPGPKPKAKE
jgi:hypothetical protein